MKRNQSHYMYLLIVDENTSRNCFFKYKNRSVCVEISADSSNLRMKKKILTKHCYLITHRDDELLSYLKVVFDSITCFLSTRYNQFIYANTVLHLKKTLK